MSKQLVIIGAPTSAGAYAPGQEKAPAAFRKYGVIEALQRAGWQVQDAGNVEGFRWRPDPHHPKSMNENEAARITVEVGEQVAQAFATGRPCSCWEVTVRLSLEWLRAHSHTRNRSA